MRTSLTFVLACACLLSVPACGSDPAESVPPTPDSGVDAEDQAELPDAADEGSLGSDSSSDAPVEAGPVSCETPCKASCDAHSALKGECAECAGTVCALYDERAKAAPNRDAFLDCLNGCGSDASCPDTCCNKYQKACAWAVTLQMCTCGFVEDDCSADCTDTCSETGLSQTCGVCGSQSPCSFATFEYLFAPSRSAHQDCVETCASSSLTLQQCLDKCRKDYPEAGTAYDGFLACVCK